MIRFNIRFSFVGLLCLLHLISAEAVSFSILETTDTHAYQYGHSFMGLDATFSNYASFITQYMAMNPDTLVLDSGDITQGTAVSAYVLPPGSAPLSTFFDLPHIISTVGNHDLNPGAADFIKYVSHAAQTPWTDRMVTSNIRMKEDPSVPMGNTLWTTRNVSGLKVAIVGVIYTEINGDRSFAHKPSSDSTCWDVDSDGVYVLWPNQTYNNKPINYNYTAEDGSIVEVKYSGDMNEATDFPAWIAKEKPDLVISLSHIPTFSNYNWNSTTNPLHPDIILNIEALRSVPGLESLPLIFLTGHSHIWDESYCRWNLTDGELHNDTNCYIWNAEKYAQVFGIVNVTMERNSSGLFLTEANKARTRVDTNIETMENILGQNLTCDLTCQQINITIASQVSRVNAWDFYGYLPNEWYHSCPYSDPHSIYNLWMKYFSPQVLKSEINMINGGNIRRAAYKGNNYFEDLVEIYPFADKVSKITGLTAEVMFYIINGFKPEAGLLPQNYNYSTTHSNTNYYCDPPINQLEANRTYTVIFDSYDTTKMAKQCADMGVHCEVSDVLGPDGQPLQIRDEFYAWFKNTYGANDTNPTGLVVSNLPTYSNNNSQNCSSSSSTDSSPFGFDPFSFAEVSSSHTTSKSTTTYAHMTKGDIAATVIVISIALACIAYFVGHIRGRKNPTSLA